MITKYQGCNCHFWSINCYFTLKNIKITQNIKISCGNAGASMWKELNYIKLNYLKLHLYHITITFIKVIKVKITHLKNI